MQRWGLTPAGKRRFRCRICGISGIRRRPDQAQRRRRDAFVKWLTSGRALADIAAHHGVGFSTVQRHFAPLWDERPRPSWDPGPVAGLVLDGTRVRKRERVVWVVQDSVRRRPVGWAFAPRESYPSWYALLATLMRAGVRPRHAVCDGQKGMLKALREVWPEVLIRRCLPQVIRQARAALTQHPHSEAAPALLSLVKQLSAIRTQRQRRRRLRAWRQWLRRYEGLLNAK